jgi:hypothetical protein
MAELHRHELLLDKSVVPFQEVRDKRWKVGDRQNVFVKWELS